MTRRLLCEKISKGLSSTPFSKILCFDSVNSTNIVALEQTMRAPGEEFVVISDAQTGGKGRHGRVWLSPPGQNIYMSLLLRPHIDIRQASSLTILSGVCLCDALRDASGLEIRIKWPNDLIINSKKLGGILIETRSEHSLVTMAVIGIGLNISLSSNDLPYELRGSASSLFMETGKIFDREGIAVKILEQFSIRYRKLFAPAADTPIRKINPDEKRNIIDRWKSLDTVLGRKISVTTSRGRLTGEAVDIDESGMLELLTEYGKVEKIHTGDIVFL